MATNQALTDTMQSFADSLETVNYLYALIIITLFLVVGTMDYQDQQQIQASVADPAAHGAVWSEPAQTWDYPEVKTYEF